jgi:hypothetical protein
LDEIQLEEDEFEANMKDAFEDAGNYFEMKAEGRHHKVAAITYFE